MQYTNPYTYPYLGYQQPFQQSVQQTVPQVQPTTFQGASTQPPPIQNGGFISVRSIEEAQRYPVAPGNAVTFKIEGQPIVCEKSQGFSQLEAPRFEVFDLIKRDMPANEQNAPVSTPNQQAVNNTPNPIKAEIEAIRSEYGALSEKYSSLENQVDNINRQIAGMAKNTVKLTKESDEE